MMGSDAKFFALTNIILAIPSGMFFAFVVPKGYYPLYIGVREIISIAFPPFFSFFFIVCIFVSFVNFFFLSVSISLSLLVVFFVSFLIQFSYFIFDLNHGR